MNLKELIFGEGVHTGGSGGVYRDSVQAWLPIKNIIGGVVITKDNRFVKIMEVLPVNIYLKSAIDRQNIISSFASYLQIAPDELQMIARTLPADTQAYVEQMQRYDDVYQQLALRLIKAVAGYDPEKGRLEQHIFAQLKYELLSCRSAYRLCGMTGTPLSFRKSHIISIDALSEDSSLYEEALAA